VHGRERERAQQETESEETCSKLTIQVSLRRIDTWFEADYEHELMSVEVDGKTLDFQNSHF
jgi:hypothetical protein